MYDHTYPNLIAETRPHGLTKSAAVTQFLELRSPLYGNRYIDDRPIDCIHRVDEDPRQVYNARPYPKNMIHSGLFHSKIFNQYFSLPSSTSNLYGFNWFYGI